MFDNQGALFMNAMTRWGHGTESVWSQPWDAAIRGPLTGESLQLLPSEVVQWGAWLERHPDTRVLTDERGVRFDRQIPNERLVIGVSIMDSAVGYYFPSARDAVIVNHQVGEFPVAVFFEPDTGAIDVYLRRVAGTRLDHSVAVPYELTVQHDAEGGVRDRQTNSRWDVARGLAVVGPLRGTAIQQIPYTTAFDRTWEDFFRGTELWGEKPILPLPDFFG